MQKDIGAVDLTPWKYRWVATALILICVAAVYLASLAARHRYLELYTAFLKSKVKRSAFALRFSSVEKVRISTLLYAAARQRA